MLTMMNTNDIPKTLLEAVNFFADYENCHNFMVRIRWSDGGVKCPTCGSEKLTYLANARLWKCYEKHARPKFSLKVGTLFEDSPLPLSKWLPVVWMIANCKNGISSYEVARALGVTQKSAWFMLHRVRKAMHTQTYQKLDGEVEVDETFIGGKARNMHRSKHEEKIHGRGAGDQKIPVMGFCQRGGEVRAEVLPNTRKHILQSRVKENVEAGAAVYSDALPSYDGLAHEYDHEVVDHAIEYVRGRVHTNGLENFWSLLKRTLKGTYVSVMPFHLHRYLDEQAFRYNLRKDLDDFGRFVVVLAHIVSRRLTYKQLIGDVG
jgi:transposase-like protein